MHPKLEIDHRALKIMIAVVAFTLANVTSVLANDSIHSISEAYKYGGWARDVLVGAMFAVAAFMFAYNGYRPLERVLTKATAVAALGVALFPGEVEPIGSRTQTLHTIASLVMFSTLAGLCWIFHLRARRKNLMRASRRALLYALCGWVMVLSMLVVVADHFLGGPLLARIPRLVFYCERVALLAFGTAWLAAGHILPWLTDQEERWTWPGTRQQ
jgi:hypothetical protein